MAACAGLGEEDAPSEGERRRERRRMDADCREAGERGDNGSVKFTDEQPASYQQKGMQGPTFSFFLNPKTTAELHGWLKKIFFNGASSIKSFNDSYCFTCLFHINGVLGMLLPQQSN